MTEKSITQEKNKTNKSAVTAGVALLVMAVLAPIAIFGILGSLVGTDNATTIENIKGSTFLFGVSVVLLLFIVALDIIVALALYRFFRPAQSAISSYMAATRIIYGLVFLGAISFLLNALLATSGTGQSIPADIELFGAIWDGALGVFGLHLILLGWLFATTGKTPMWLGVLLIVAGLGYAIDSMGKLLIPGYSVEVSSVTFMGELVLIFWLLIKGRTTEIEPKHS